MPLQSGGRAPYAPPAAVLGFLQAYRDRAVPSPITAEVLVRAGVSDSLAPRTLQSLVDLDLIREDGTPTDEMEGLRRTAQDAYPQRLESLIRSVYGEVFRYVDPTQDDLSRISDQFRAFEPIGQRGRMVTLFLGLCEAAGLATRRASATPSNGAARTRPATRPRREEPTRRPASVSARARIRNNEDGLIPAAITGLLASLPAEGEGWTKQRKDAFAATIRSALDLWYPDAIETPTATPNDNDTDE